ncbi:ras-related protein rab, partial [Staphylotrichum tortipilum]
VLFRYCDRGFDSYMTTTVGVDYKMKDLMVGGKAYRLNIFDTAGQERFHSLGTSHYRGAHAVLLAYDLSSRATFDALDRWFDEARAHAPEGAVLGLVGTKLDRAGPSHSPSLSLTSSSPPEGSREVSFSEGQAKADARGAAVFCEVSALTGENVTAPFRGLVAEVLRTPGLVEAIGRRPWPAAGRGADPHPYRTLAGELVGGGVRVVGEVAGVGVRVVKGKVAGAARCWC